MGDLDRDARIRKEAEEKKRQEQAEQHAREEEELKRQQQEYEAKAEAKRAEAEAKSQPEAPKQQEEQAQAQDQTDEKHLRKRDNPEPEQQQQQQQQEQAAVAVEEAPPQPHSNEPESYTLCSPQLLHLDVDDTPLWFNGWLLDNKFADKRQKKFGSFKHYLIEPREVRDPGAWQLHENNECCLTTDREKMHPFSNEEVKLLERMMQKAREVGAPGA